MADHSIEKGLAKVYTKETIISQGSEGFDTGALDYLVSTPSIILMIIEYSHDMLDKLLPQGSDYITVGKKFELDHEHPSLLGETIAIKLEVENVVGNIVSLNIEVNDSKGRVCVGKHERAIVDKNKLLDIAYKRSPDLI